MSDCETTEQLFTLAARLIDSHTQKDVAFALELAKSCGIGLKRVIFMFMLTKILRTACRIGSERSLPKGCKVCTNIKIT